MSALKAGYKLNVRKEDKYLRAEILSVRFQEEAHSTQYYVHFDGYNKRLDEWVSHDRLDLSTVELPTPPEVKAVRPPTPSSKKRKRPPSKSKLSRLSQIVDLEEKEKDEDDAVVDDEEDADHEPTFSKEKELEKLRTSGSMTQSLTEISRLKNINTICIGRFQVDTWYFSPYPEQMTMLDVLHLCGFCLEPCGTLTQLARHRLKCTLHHPPGNEIYRKDDISFFEIDGRKQRTYCHNLSLLSKLFLDHKTLYYDVDPFLFYIMTKTDERGMHLVGYFSKEKSSAEEYNVACILTLPQYQRMGYGKLLIAFSYELSKIEHKLGSPEKPLSDLGLLSYRSFWAEKIIAYLSTHAGEISLAELSEATAFTMDDVLQTLQSCDLLKYYKGNFVIYINDEARVQYETNVGKTRVRVDPSKLEWTPPKFQPSQLRFI